MASPVRFLMLVEMIVMFCAAFAFALTDGFVALLIAVGGTVGNALGYFAFGRDLP